MTSVPELNGTIGPANPAPVVAAGGDDDADADVAEAADVH